MGCIAITCRNIQETETQTICLGSGKFQIQDEEYT